MPEPVEVQYRDLLNPIKDPERSFSINISELLQSYITNFVQGRIPPNFNSAALLLQGSSSIYGKKVEYLHNLATQLYQNLLKHKKEQQAKKDPKEKEKNNKENKQKDPFFSIEIKLGKNLSCLRKKNASKNVKKGQKKASGKKYTFVPVDLLSLEGEEKGDVFYDTRGEAVGNKSDYTLNKCRVTTCGWLLLPTISLDLIPSALTPLDYSLEMDEDVEDLSHSNDVEMPASTPDDKESPVSSGYDSSPPTAPSSQTPMSQPTDEGLGSLTSTPMEGPSQPVSNSEEPIEGASQNVSTSEEPMDGVASSALDGIENIPLDGLPENGDLAPKPVRRSMRKVLKPCQLEPEEGSQNPSGENVNEPQHREEEPLVVKRAIQKKKTSNLPSKLRVSSDENSAMCPVSVFCARTYFCMDPKILRRCLLSFQCAASENNTKLCNKLLERAEGMNSANRNRKKIIGCQEEDEFIDIEGFDDVETLNCADPENDIVRSPLEDDDIVIDNEPVIPPLNVDEIPVTVSDQLGVERVDGDSAENIVDADDEMDASGFKDITQQIVIEFVKDIHTYIPPTEIADNVHKWEKSVKPYLNSLIKREKFDINVYGSDILNSFEDNNRRQTITFRNFCRDKEKYQIHRYFMALLPLVNIGNVHIEPERTNEGDDDIMVTLLSRRMHHIELETFGHAYGEHS